jgi:hypothetical protein
MPSLADYGFVVRGTSLSSLTAARAWRSPGLGLASIAVPIAPHSALLPTESRTDLSAIPPTFVGIALA